MIPFSLATGLDSGRRKGRRRKCKGGPGRILSRLEWVMIRASIDRPSFWEVHCFKRDGTDVGGGGGGGVVMMMRSRTSGDSHWSTSPVGNCLSTEKMQ